MTALNNQMDLAKMPHVQGTVAFNMDDMHDDLFGDDFVADTIAAGSSASISDSTTNPIANNRATSTNIGVDSLALALPPSNGLTMPKTPLNSNALTRPKTPPSHQHTFTPFPARDDVVMDPSSFMDSNLLMDPNLLTDPIPNFLADFDMSNVSIDPCLLAMENSGGSNVDVFNLAGLNYSSNVASQTPLNFTMEGEPGWDTICQTITAQPPRYSDPELSSVPWRVNLDDIGETHQMADNTVARQQAAAPAAAAMAPTDFNNDPLRAGASGPVHPDPFFSLYGSNLLPYTAPAMPAVPQPAQEVDITPFGAAALKLPNFTSGRTMVQQAPMVSLGSDSAGSTGYRPPVRIDPSYIPHGSPIPHKRSVQKGPDDDFYPKWRFFDWGLSAQRREGPTFAYHESGEWMSHLVFSAEQLEQYMEATKDTLTIWIQHQPAQYTHRFGQGSAAMKCRFKDCPNRNRTILKGFWRVSFDERAAFDKPLESGTLYDPFHNAGYAHLYCLERHFDLMNLCNRFTVKVDLRDLRFEQRNPMKISRDHVELAAVFPVWLRERQKDRQARLAAGDPHALEQPRSKRLKLWYMLTEETVSKQSHARQRTRDARGGISLDRHMGDLRKYTREVDLRVEVQKSLRTTEKIHMAAEVVSRGLRRRRAAHDSTESETESEVLDPHAFQQHDGDRDSYGIDRGLMESPGVFSPGPPASPRAAPRTPRISRTKRRRCESNAHDLVVSPNKRLKTLPGAQTSNAQTREELPLESPSRRLRSVVVRQQQKQPAWDLAGSRIYRDRREKQEAIAIATAPTAATKRNKHGDAIATHAATLKPGMAGKTRAALRSLTVDKEKMEQYKIDYYRRFRLRCRSDTPAPIVRRGSLR